jgi:hypothetical protein
MIFFYHIPKTAGLSVVRAAEEAIAGPARRILLPQMAEWMAGVAEGRSDTGGVAFLSGHFAYGVHTRLPAVARTFTFLRHPVDQTVSMHREAAKRMDIYPHGPLHALLTNGAGWPYFGNAQVRHLSSTDGTPVMGSLTPAHLARAKHVVTRELNGFGLTEYYTASLALLNHHFGTRLRPKRENVSPTGASPRDLDPDLLLMIREANALDLELYDYAQTVFVDRLRSLQAVPSAAAEW